MFLGGTWSLLSGGYVLKSIESGTGGSTAAAGNTGTNNGNTGSTTLTGAQSGMPKHAHAVRYSGQSTQIQSRDGTVQPSLTPGWARGVGWWGTLGSGALADVWADDVGPYNASQGHTHTLNNHAHTAGMPQNIGVYVWKRTA